MVVSRMKLLILCVSALCCAAVCVSGQQDVRGDTTSTGRYSFYNFNVWWSSAYKACKDQSSHLAVIESQEEADNIETLMRIYDVQRIHVGLSDKYESGRYVTILDQDLDSIGYNKWRVGYPNSSLGSCVGFSLYGGEVGLYNYDCTTIQPGLCEERRWDHFTLVPDFGYYYAYGSSRTWPEARRNCRQQGAHLVILNSREELQAVYRDLFYSWAFVGLTDKLYTGMVVSLFNTPIAETGYSNWQSVPANNSNSPFVAVFQSIFLAPETLTSQKTYLCEHELHTN